VTKSICGAYVSGVAGGLGQGGTQVDGGDSGQSSKSNDDTPHVVQVVDVCTCMTATSAHVKPDNAMLHTA